VALATGPNDDEEEESLELHLHRKAKVHNGLQCQFLTVTTDTVNLCHRTWYCMALVLLQSL